jgi:tetratricopeptide (TPR) repeat protein
MREARGLVQFLIAKPLSPDEAAAAIRRDPTITEAVRQQALAWIEPFWRSQARSDAARNALALNAASWAMVRQLGADAAAYQQACARPRPLAAWPRTVPTISTRSGVAYYRVGKYPEALAALEKSHPGNAFTGVDAAGLYFLAMCHYRLGDAAKARECFERAKDSHQRNATRLTNEQSEELKRFRMEAETLLGQPANSVPTCTAEPSAN